ncbi:conjugal transfer protein TrbE [Nitratireductor sp. XY-223]|uniref:conjugal transfer protein TrbE n=1 Tax=Nitratireductor sp. XY-223 TaxID=2561926 RepID=UPI0010AA75C3|nr:conjugal transfer protein TrbE [Nitratireductor sp. XY-223]
MLNLTEYRKKPDRLADYLPWACLVAPGIVLNKDGSFQRTIRYRGPDLESATESELISITARINNVLRRFGSGWALFFEATRIEATAYPESNFPDAASWLVDQERKETLQAEGSHFESRFYLTFLFLPPPDATGRSENLLFEKTDDKRSGPNYQDHLDAFIVETDRAIDLLTTLLPKAHTLDDDQTLTYLHDTISTDQHQVRTPETPAYLDAILPDAPLTGGLDPVLGEEHLRCLTITGFPGSTVPGLLDELNDLGFAYRWVTRFIALDKQEAMKLLTRLRRQWFSKRKSVAAILREVMFNQESVLLDSDAGNKTADADEALQELGADDVSFGYVTATIVVQHADPIVADAMLRNVERVINGKGFVSIWERLNAVEAWLGALPGNPYANVRQPVLHTLNLAHMMPVSAVWAGPLKNRHLDAPALLTARTRGSTPFRLDLHVGDVGHSLIVGPTGAGKSVLLSLLALQFRRYSGSQVFVFDKGKSARAAVLAMGGSCFDLALDGGLSFQPLAEIHKGAEQSFALSWICGLLANEGVEIAPETKDAVWQALLALASAPAEERTLTGFATLLQSNRLRQALVPYTLEGAFGRLLDAAKDDLTISDVQHFEMEELLHHKQLVLPVLTYLFHRLEARFDGRPALLVLDEAWVFLDDPLFAARIREWLKTLRKKNVSVVFATQSLADIENSSIAPALIESCPSRVFLPNDRALEPQTQSVYQRFGLNSRQIELIARAVPKRDYYYQSQRGNRLFELGLGPIGLAFCATSSAADQKQIDAIHHEHGNRQSFADAWLRAKGLDWAADLLTGFAHEHETLTDPQDQAQTTADMIDSPQQPITPNDSSKGVPQ